MMKVIIPALIKDNTAGYVKACEYMGIKAIVSDNILSPDSFDGLLLPGGADINPGLYGQENKGSLGVIKDRDKLQLDAIDMFLGQNKPIFGTCRGLQLLNVYFGGTLKQDIKGHRIENNGLHPVHIEKECPYYKLLSDSISGCVMVNSTHHQCLDVVAGELTVFALSDDGIKEGVYNLSRRIIAVQWHPERLIGMGGEKIYNIFKAMMVQGFQ